MNLSELQEKVEAYISPLWENMGLGIKPHYEVEEVGSDEGLQTTVTVTFEGDDLGYMIGRGGQHLNSLQYILSLMVNRKFAEDPDSRIYVYVDVGGYKKDRDNKIETLALRLAEDARILGEPVDMDPMNSTERRVVHMILSKFDDIQTESFGEGRNRYVRIIPVQEESERQEETAE
ncbi:KH domain-containing protein [Candidatus Dojkabacteria bacterium]|uniref:KH domain-containing protein n=1 Tax=Candidatus Dojkabacteria bacterium TaxID=2099670 RepID=A0A955HY72_9BACT|nr:KH domain-containing protein [Candidatus Dojkabacteria bacterium]